ncbi:MAG: Xaa-Pro peptidase family protein [bacterium]|nr:Xaa-Pro peptidase family protein [bacterium]MDT8365649.1 Xaa-Pro peptidase family protein [bacterium]
MPDYDSIALTYNTVPEEEIRSRISRFQSLLQRQEIKAALIVQLIDRFYFSGTIQDGVLIIPAEGDPRYLCRRSLERAKAETPLQLIPFKSFKEIPLSLEDLDALHATRLGLELDVIPAALYQRFSSMVEGADWVDLGPLVREVRAIKSAYEIERIRAAGVQVGKVIDTARETLTEGMREVEFASILEKRARELGHQGILRMRGFNQELFYGHIITGEHSALMSHIDAPSGGKGVNPSIAQGAGFRTIKRNEPVSVDFVGNVGGYLIDQTRLMVIGDLDEGLEEGFNQARDIQGRVVLEARPGAAWSSLYDTAVSAAGEMGIADRFMGPPGEQVRFVGHGVGLEVDEYPFLAPRLDCPLAVGMVFALEPKVFHPGKGITGIEDTYLVTDDGLERLTVTEREIIKV